MLSWHDDETDAACRCLLEVAGGFDRRIERDAWQERAVDLTRRDVVDDIRFARPKCDAMTT